MPLCGALFQMAFERQHYMISVTVRIIHDRSVKLWRKEGMRCHPSVFVCVCLCAYGTVLGCRLAGFLPLALLSASVGFTHACMTAAGARCKCVLA